MHGWNICRHGYVAHAGKFMQVSLMLENGDTRDDLALPSGTEEYERLAKQIQTDFADGKELLVTVTKVGHHPAMLTAASSCQASSGASSPRVVS